MVNANKKRGTTLKQRFVKWLLSEYVDSEIYQQMENAGLHDAVSKVDDIEYQVQDFECKVDDMESKVDNFEYETIDNIRDEAERTIQDAKDDIMSLVNEAYDVELNFKRK
jgi:divalent metal cation (Fe/Co/Zn/Cd) transporter